jgi:hypothetical protein
MLHNSNPHTPAIPARPRTRLTAWLAGTVVTVSAVFGLAAAPQAKAADGCLVLLCLAGNWKQIPMCVPAVKQVLRDIARGRPFPTCNSADAQNRPNFTWTNQGNCPVFYSQYNAENGSWLACNYPALITVNVNGQLWSEVFISMVSEDTSTRYTDGARQSLGERIDPKYDIDSGYWTANNPPAPTTEPSPQGSYPYTPLDGYFKAQFKSQRHGFRLN